MIDYRHQYGTPWYPYIVRLSKRSFPLPASPGEQAGSTEGSWRLYNERLWGVSDELPTTLADVSTC